MKRKPKKPRKPKTPKLTGRDRHHLIPKSRGGKATPQNLLLISIVKHIGWHKLFGTMTFDEVIALLIRVRDAKQKQKG